VTRTERQRLDELRSRVASLYLANRRQGRSDAGVEFDYVCPAPAIYPYQWFWDSCFHAIVLSRFDVPRAEAELVTLCAAQRPDGFIPHVSYWEGRGESGGAYVHEGTSRARSDSMQPPILAEAVAAVASRGRGAAFLREILPAVNRYYAWVERERDADGDGLIAVFEPHETGMDQAPVFDALLGVTTDRASAAEFEAAWRAVMESNAEVDHDVQAIVARDRFVVADVLVNVLYAENLRVLAGLLAEVDDDVLAGAVRERAERTAAAIAALCWSDDDGEFHALAGRELRPLPSGTLGGLMPLLLPELPEPVVEAMASRIADPAHFGTPFPVPSVSRTHPAYQPAPRDDVLWRGPTWINTNWYLARGLRRHGREALATAIEDASLELVERSGFREHYNPETGTGLGARDFAWSALVLDMAESRLSP